MKKAQKSVLMATFAVALAFVLATGSPVQAQRGPSSEDRTIDEVLRSQDGAQAFLAMARVGQARCPRISRLLDRRRASLVALVPHNVAFEEFLSVTPRTFQDLDIEEIAGLLPEILERKELRIRDVCRLLRRHISQAQAQTVHELLDRGFITMLNGDEVPVTIGRGGVVFANNSPITVYDVFTQNGVVQYLDRVIPPEDTPSGNVVQVFLTNSIHLGNFAELAESGNGLDGADAFCQTAAETAGLSGTWTAWLSDDLEDAAGSIPNGEYRLVNGTLVASNKADLTDGVLKHPINVNEFGNQSSNTVWSGTDPSGNTWMDAVMATSNCANWTNADGNTSCAPGEASCATQGNSSKTDGEWTLIGGQSSPFLSACSAPHALYCFGRE